MDDVRTYINLPADLARQLDSYGTELGIPRSSTVILILRKHFGLPRGQLTLPGEEPEPTGGRRRR